jgi:hypothetical protein
MSRSVVGLLAAVGTAMSAFVGLAHGDLVWVILVNAAAATGAAACLALPPKKVHRDYTELTASGVNRDS